MVKSERRLAAALVELSDTLVDDFDVVDFLHLLCRHGVELLDAGAAGVMLIDDEGRLRVLAASSEEVELLELFQIQQDEGPCLESHHSGRPVMAHSPEELLRRWPRFGERVVEQFRSMYAFPMRLRTNSLGALNLYGNRDRCVDADDMPLGQALADVATIGLLQQASVREASVLSQQLQHALNSRVIIEQAKGKYAERHGVDVGSAFELLRNHSRRNNMKLAEVAARFLDDTISVDAPLS